MLIKYVDGNTDLVTMQEFHKVELVKLGDEKDKAYMLVFVSATESFIILEAHTTSFTLCNDVLNTIYYTGKYDFSTNANFVTKTESLLKPTVITGDFTDEDIAKLFGFNDDTEEDE